MLLLYLGKNKNLYDFYLIFGIAFFEQKSGKFRISHLFFNNIYKLSKHSCMYPVSHFCAI